MVNELEQANIVLPVVVHPQFLATFAGNEDIVNVAKYMTFFMPAINIITQYEIPGEDDSEKIYSYISIFVQIAVSQCVAAYALNKKAHASIY